MKISLYYIVYAFVAIFFNAIQGQELRASAASKSLEVALHDSVRIKLNIEKGQKLSASTPDSALFYYSKAIRIAEQFLETTQTSTEELGIKKQMASALMSVGAIYRYRNDFSKALECYTNSLVISEEINDKYGIAHSLNGIGIIYRNQGDTVKAMESHKRSLKIRDSLGDKIGIAHSLNNIGVLYNQQGNIEKTLEYYLRSLSIKEEVEDRVGLALTQRNIGTIYLGQNKPFEALEFFFKSLKIREELGDKRAIASTLISLGEAYFQLGDIVRAEKSGSRAYKLGLEVGYPSIIERASRLLKGVNEEKGNYRKAYEFFQTEVKMRDSIANEENFRETMRQQARYEWERKMIKDSLNHLQTIVVKDLQIAKKIEETKMQRFAIYALVFVFISMIVFAFSIYRNYLLKKESNRVIMEKNEMLEKAYNEITKTSEALKLQNETLREQYLEISSQRNEIEEQRNALANLAWELQEKGEEIEQQSFVLESKNKDITDSILYAQRIQNAVLPSLNLLETSFKEHFVLYLPKSIVSGDFYWSTKIRDLLVFCVTDCTGHGVPGAFMSIMGISFLNEIVRNEEVTNAADVLETLRKYVVSSLSGRDDDIVFDGMDIGLCILNTTSNTLQFAGANIPCWISSSSPNSRQFNDRIVLLNGLIELKPDRMPIGRFEFMSPFSFIDIELQKDDIIYLATDGFIDQFGGPNEKKFQKARLMELLSKNRDKPLMIQKQIIEKVFEEWKGQTIQIDDVTILGVKTL